MLDKASIYDRIWTNSFTPQEQIFLMELAQGETDVDAARKAGYSEASLRRNIDKLMARPEARLEMMAIKEEFGMEAGGVKLSELVREFEVIAKANVADLLDEFGEFRDLSDIDPEKARAIKEVKRSVNPRTGVVTITYTMHDKIAALQNLGRIGGHYAADNGQQQGDVNIQINLPGGITAL